MGLKGFLQLQSLVTSGRPIHLLYSCLKKVSNLVAQSPRGEFWSISYVYLLGTQAILKWGQTAKVQSSCSPFLLGDPWHEDTDLYPWCQGRANKRDFFPSSSCLFLVWKKKQELEQNKCEKLQLGEHWVFDIFSY